MIRVGIQPIFTVKCIPTTHYSLISLTLHRNIQTFLKPLFTSYVYVLASSVSLAMHTFRLPLSLTHH